MCRAGSAMTLRTRETQCDLIRPDAGERIIYLRRVRPVSSVLLTDPQLGKSLGGKNSSALWNIWIYLFYISFNICSSSCVKFLKRESLVICLVSDYIHDSIRCFHTVWVNGVSWLPVKAELTTFRSTMVSYISHHCFMFLINDVYFSRVCEIVELLRSNSQESVSEVAFKC